MRNLLASVRPHMTPRLVILGAQKAGTTAFFTMLAKHPKALPPHAKELDFFAEDALYAKGMTFYRSLFPAIPLKSFGHFTFEASPSYLYYADKCAPRIAKNLPRATCVAILRDPVQRAFSAWNMRRDFINHPRRAHLHDSRSFAQAVDDELSGREKDPTKLYLKRGLYSGQIAPFLELLPREQVLVFSYNEFKADPKQLIDRVLGSAKLEPYPSGTELTHVKVHAQPYTAKLDESLASELYDYYATDVSKLKDLLGYDIDIMKK